MKGKINGVLAAIALSWGVFLSWGVLSAGTPGGAQGVPSVTMSMLMERTLFQVDVLTLLVRIEGETAVDLRSLVSDGELDGETADSAASLITDADRAYARLDFLRGFSMGRFIDGIEENAEVTEAAGVIDRATRDFLIRSLPDWYSFLDGRGVREGDWMEYFIRGDTLTVHYRSNEGALLLDRTDVGPVQRRSVLGGYVVPGSNFREGLMESLFEGER